MEDHAWSRNKQLSMSGSKVLNKESPMRVKRNESIAGQDREIKRLMTTDAARSILSSVNSRATSIRKTSLSVATKTKEDTAKVRSLAEA